MTTEEVLRTAQDLLDRSKVLERELELFYQREIEQGHEPGLIETNFSEEAEPHND